MLDVRRLRILREVARHGSFTGAAQALSYTPAAVSAQIATLEREVGATLLHRGPRGARLTEAGARLVGHAEAILELVEQAEVDMDALLAARGQRLRLAAFASSLPMLIPAALERLQASAPGADVMIVEAGPDEALERLGAGEVELALVFEHGDPVPYGGGLEAAHLFDDPVFMAVASGHRLASGPFDAEDMMRESWIAPKSGPAHRAFHASPMSGAHVVVETDDMRAHAALAAAGLGVGLVTGILDWRPPGLVLRRLPAEKRSVFGVLRADRHGSPLLREALEALSHAGRAMMGGVDG